ncbi:hypothetical protein [Modestobacter sp. URMC 112]
MTGWGQQPPPRHGEDGGWDQQPPPQAHPDAGWGGSPQSPPTPYGPGPAGPGPYGGAPGWDAPRGPVGPGGPTGPGWPGGPPGPRRSGGTNKALLIAGIAGLVTVLAVAVLLFLGLRGGSDSSAAESAPPTPAGPSAPSPADLQAFLATLPADFTDCGEAPRAGDGDLLAAGCGAAGTQPGPTGARFYLYPDVRTLDAVFSNDVDSSGLTEFTDEQDCSTSVGYGAWQTTGETGGLYGCAILDDGTVSLAWTDDRFLTEGIVSAPGTTQADVAALYAWWTEHSYYQG